MKTLTSQEFSVFLKGQLPMALIALILNFGLCTVTIWLVNFLRIIDA